MAAYESTAFLIVIALLLAGVSHLAAEQITISKKFFSNSALEKSLTEIYSKAELLPPGSQAHAKIFLPKNTTHATSETDGGWTMKLTVGGTEYTKTSSVKLTPVPSNLFETPGTHRVLIRKESEKSAILLEMQ